MTIEIEGKTFQKKTGNVCTTCAAAKRYLYVKMVTASKDVVLECVACGDIRTVHPSSVLDEVND